MPNGGTAAKILAQIERAEGLVPIKIFVQAKGKEPANDTLPQFLVQYCKSRRVGTFLKEQHTGKLVADWEKLISEAPEKPELVDMSPAISAAMSVKDEEELVSRAALQPFSGHSSWGNFQKAVQTAGSLTSTLLKHHVAPKLESILDKESKITHEMLSVQVEARLGSGEGKDAKGPDMKVWSKGKNLDKVNKISPSNWLATEG
jgi:nucleosome binding factor SPN SPT16 subunit